MYKQTIFIIVLLVYVKCIKRVVVIKDIIDNRAQQIDSQPNFTFDENQNTQHLFQECLIQHDNKTEPGWIYIESPFQPQKQKITGKWTGYMGYVHQDDVSIFDSTIVKLDEQGCPKYDFIVRELVTNVYSRNCGLNGCIEEDLVIIASMGTRFVSVDHQLTPNLGWLRVYLLGLTDSNGQTRIGYIHAADVNILSELEFSNPDLYSLVEYASKMIGWKYFWGGRSSFRMGRIPQFGKLSGVDCSGLTGILYNTIIGMIIPRDAHDQFLKSTNISDPNNIDIGDLLFFRGISTERITHVMLYVGDGYIAESTAFSNSTRMISIKDRYCIDSLSQLSWDMIVCEGQGPDKQQARIRWGTYLGPYVDNAPWLPTSILYILITIAVIFIIGSSVIMVSLFGRYFYMKKHSSETRYLTKHNSFQNYGEITETDM